MAKPYLSVCISLLVMLYMTNDMKIWGNMIRLVLLKTIGQAYLHPVPLKELDKHIITEIDA